MLSDEHLTFNDFGGSVWKYSSQYPRQPLLLPLDGPWREEAYAAQIHKDNLIAGIYMSFGVRAPTGQMRSITKNTMDPESLHVLKKLVWTTNSLNDINALFDWYIRWLKSKDLWVTWR